MALAASGERLFFSADDETHGRELWVSDGTTDGTTLVKDINVHFGFELDSARPNSKNGTLRVRGRADAPGELTVRPLGGSELKRANVDVAEAGRVVFVLKPTRAGMRELRRTGVLKVRAEITFTPCSGEGSSPSSRS